MLTDPYYLDLDKHLDDAILNFLRYRNIKNYHKNFDDVFSFSDAFPDVNFRHLIMPNSTLVNSIDEIRFDPDVTEPMQLKGRKDGEFHYHTQEGLFFNAMDEWR